MQGYLKRAATSTMTALCITVAIAANVQAQEQPSQAAAQESAGHADASQVKVDADRSAAGSTGTNDINGVNTGREVQFNVPGCVGPTSFCNLYFGS
jgi:opacity protein-like surface antigen